MNVLLDNYLQWKTLYQLGYAHLYTARTHSWWFPSAAIWAGVLAWLFWAQMWSLTSTVFLRDGPGSSNSSTALLSPWKTAICNGMSPVFFVFWLQTFGKTPFLCAIVSSFCRGKHRTHPTIWFLSYIVQSRILLHNAVCNTNSTPKKHVNQVTYLSRLVSWNYRCNNLYTYLHSPSKLYDFRFRQPSG